jgi:hypothetical protein
MEINLDTMRRLTRPTLERTLDHLARLEQLPLADVEPATQFRVI